MLGKLQKLQKGFYFKSLKTSYSFAKELASLYTFIVAILTALSMLLLVQKIFGFQFVGPFGSILDVLQKLSSLFVELVIFIWIRLLFLFATFILSLFTDIRPTFPDFVVPQTIAVLSLISILFVRIFQYTDDVISHLDRRKLEAELSEEQKAQIYTAEGIWKYPHKVIETTHLNFYRPSQKFIDKVLLNILSKMKFAIKPEKFPVGSVIMGAFMWGYVHLAGYLINVPLTSGLNFPILQSRRKTLRAFIYLFVLSVLFAVLILVVDNMISRIPISIAENN